MRVVLLYFCLCLCALRAQQQQGVSTEWEIGKTLEGIASHATRLDPILDQLQPQDWVAKGAPEQYVTQWKNSRTEAKALAQAAEALKQKPDRLPDALQVLFRIQSLHTMLQSLGEGIRKYHNPAVADLLNAVVAEGGANRARLQQYIVDLATEKEQEFRVADQEAQRCRESISRQPAPARRTDRK